MAIHDVYVGGPATANFNRAQFPNPPFVAAGADFLAVRPAAHQGPNGFSLSRVLDFGFDAGALAHWYRNTTLAQGDDLRIMLIPQDVLIQGIFVEVETPSPVGTAATATLTLEGVTGGTFGAAVNLAVAAKSYRAVGGAAVTTSATIGTGLVPFFIATPTVLTMDLTAFTPAIGFGDLRLKITAQVVDLHSGQW